MHRPALPEKLYFRIGEVAALVGVAPHVLRYWEAEFPGVRPEKSPSGQRIYARRDVLRLLEIHRLVRDLGYTFDGARRALQLADEAPVASESHAPPAAHIHAVDRAEDGAPAHAPPAAVAAPPGPVEAPGEPEALLRVVALRGGLLRARMSLSRALLALSPEGDLGPTVGAGERSSEP